MQNAEQSKYERLWSLFDQYRIVAPGESLAPHFMELARPQPHQTVIDFGCGTGRGAAAIAGTGSSVLAIDFVDGCLDKSVRARLGDRFKFLQHDLTKPLDTFADFGYCTDVMEHIPTVDVSVVLANIVKAARRVYFGISLVEDRMGALIGEPLHLTVRPFDWWAEQFERLHCRVMWSRDLGSEAIFYVSAYATFDDFEHKTVIHAEDRLTSNIKANLALSVNHVAPHIEQTTEINLLCGGPSLNDFVDQIKQSGRPIVTVNGAYNWAIDHGMKPGAQVIVDAREFNVRFTTPHLPDCKYLVCSQCDPSLVASLPANQVWLWNGAGDQVKAAIDEFSSESGKTVEWYPVPGGTTVTLRALPLLAMLGYRRIHVYGFDSCVRYSIHHAYSQPENDGIGVIPISVNGKEFRCHGWMVKQAQEFQEVVRYILAPADVQLEVYGDGLIANILQAAAHAASKEN